jgi:hypothetical protein
MTKSWKLREVLWLTATVTAAFLGSLVPLISNNRFYHYDDTQAGAFGIWFELGTKIRAGEWPFFSDSAWGAGNYAAEGQWGIWNPLILLIGYLASDTPNIVVFSTIMKIVCLCILAGGTFGLARSYGASPEWASATGVAVTLTGFTVYMDAASWVTGLMVFCLLPLTWLGLRRLSKDGKNPLGALVPGYVLITIGYVHGTLMLAVVFVGLLLEALLSGDRKSIPRLLAAGFISGLIALAVYLPGVLTAPVTSRAGGILNNGFLAPDLTGMAAAWVPGSLPQITGWWGDYAPVPLLYVAWFLPVLAAVDFDKAKAGMRGIAALLVVGLVSLALTLAPSDLGPLRFPARLMPYVSLAVLVTLAVLVSKYRLQLLSRARLIGAAVIVAFGLYLAWSQYPSFRIAGIFGSVALAGLTGIYLLHYHRRLADRFRGGTVLAGWIIMVSMVVALGQHLAFRSSPLPDYRMPDTIDGYSSQLSGAKGSTFVVGDPTRLDPEVWKETLAANAWYLNPAEVQNLYSPIMYAAYTHDLCITTHGWACNKAAEKLFETDAATGRVLADLLSIDSVQILRDRDTGFNEMNPSSPPEGWHEVSASGDSRLWVRDTPLLNTGGVVWTSDGLTLDVVSETSAEVVLRVVGQNQQGGEALLSRLAWPGYQVTGAELSAPDRGYLLKIRVPEGSTGQEVVIRFEPPGWPLVVGSLASGVAIGLGWGVYALVARRRRSTVDDSPGGNGASGSSPALAVSGAGPGT